MWSHGTQAHLLVRHEDGPFTSVVVSSKRSASRNSYIQQFG